MKRMALFVLLVGVLVASSTSALGTTRGPITILGNSGFTADNGVVGGRGTAEDPYLISGWEITLGAGEKYGVKIENATASFVLRGLIIQGANDGAGAAIRIGYSRGGRIEDCAISNSINGLEIVASTDMTVRSTVMYVIGVGLRVAGDAEEEYRQDIDTSNLLNDQEILYYYGVDGQTIEGRKATHLMVAASRDVTISGNEIVNGDGIQLAFVTDSTVVGNSVYRSSNVPTEHGIFLYQSNRNLISGNSLRNNRLAGVQLTLSAENEVSANQVLANDSGIRLVASDRNQVLDNILYADVTGVLITGGSDANVVAQNIIYHENTAQGILLESGTSNRIERNGLSDCEVGIFVAEQAVQNTIAANTIVNGGYGISLSGSGNTFDGNLIAQQSRGILFPETYTRSVTRNNKIVRNVFTDNGSNVYVNLDSDNNQFSRNLFFSGGVSSVADHGTTTRWTLDGVGNYWAGTPVIDQNEDGVGESFVTIYPSGAEDDAPVATPSAAEAGMGILGTLDPVDVTIDRADGTPVKVEARVATEGYERWVGFRGFPPAMIETSPGILFQFDVQEQYRFTMSTVLFDLDIAFFGEDGSFVGGATMKADSKEDVYTASSPFQYALELPVGGLEALGLDLGATLRRP